MNTHLFAPPSAVSAAPVSSVPSAPPEPKTQPGRPTQLTARMADALCDVIRRTGASDSAAAAGMCLHPSTVSRWKKANPDFAILLRNARECFRAAQLAIIEDMANSGKASGWRAAAWLLERIFPEDYSPRAKERALFQDRFDAICAAEAEGAAIALPDEGEALQNVKNSTPPAVAMQTAAPLR